MKNFENRSVFVKVTAKDKVGRFFETVYTVYLIHRGVARNLFWGGIKVFGEV